MSKINKLIIFAISLSVFGVTLATVPCGNNPSTNFCFKNWSTTDILSVTVHTGGSPDISGGCGIYIVKPCNPAGPCPTMVAYQPSSPVCSTGEHPVDIILNDQLVHSYSSVGLGPNCNFIVNYQSQAEGPQLHGGCQNPPNK